MATFSKLTKEEQERIAQQVHADYQKICQEVKQQMTTLDLASKERVEKKLLQEKKDLAALRDMKPSFFQWVADILRR